MGRIVFVNRYGPPDHAATSQLTGELAFALAAGGQAVEIVTGRQLYDDPAARLPARETIGGVLIRRVAGTRFGRGSLPGRAMDYASFYVAAFAALLCHLRAGDTVVAETDPPLVSVVAALAVRLRGARLVNWLQDVFPEVAAALGYRAGSGAVGAALRALRNRSLRRAAVNVALGERMAARLRAEAGAGAAVTVIPNWADGAAIAPVPRAANPLRAAWGLGERFVVGYAGNLGRAHDTATVLAAARLLADDPSIAFLFVGGGARRAALEQAARDERLPILFQPYQPRAALAASLSAPDVHLVSLHPALEGLIVPSKAVAAMAAGRPLLVVGDPAGEVAALAARHHCGLAVPWGDGAALAAAVRRLAADRASADSMGAAARAAFLAHYDRPHALAAWRAVLRLTAAP